MRLVCSAHPRTQPHGVGNLAQAAHPNVRALIVNDRGVRRVVMYAMRAVTKVSYPTAARIRAIRAVHER